MNYFQLKMTRNILKVKDEIEKLEPAFQYE